MPPGTVARWAARTSCGAGADWVPEADRPRPRPGPAVAGTAGSPGGQPGPPSRRAGGPPPAGRRRPPPPGPSYPSPGRAGRRRDVGPTASPVEASQRRVAPAWPPSARRRHRAGRRAGSRGTGGSPGWRPRPRRRRGRRGPVGAGPRRRSSRAAAAAGPSTVGPPSGTVTTVPARRTGAAAAGRWRHRPPPAAAQTPAATMASRAPPRPCAGAPPDGARSCSPPSVWPSGDLRRAGVGRPGVSAGRLIGAVGRSSPGAASGGRRRPVPPAAQALGHHRLVAAVARLVVDVAGHRRPAGTPGRPTPRGGRGGSA